jgi:single-strand DNA-binding protein
MSLNKVMLIGNVGRDPDVRYIDGAGTSAGTKVATFSLATTERYRDRSGELRENTEWHDIVAWRQAADIVERFVRKGTQLYIEGRLRTRSYVGQDGVKKSTTEITVDNLQMLGRRSDNEEQGASQGEQQGNYQRTRTQQGGGRQEPEPAPVQEDIPGDTPDLPDSSSSDDLPF